MKNRLVVNVSVAACCGVVLTVCGGTENVARWTNVTDAVGAWTDVSGWTDASGSQLASPPLDGESVYLAPLPAVPAGGDGKNVPAGSYLPRQRLNTGTSATGGSSHDGEVNPVLAAVAGGERHEICIDTTEGSGAYYYPTGNPVLTPDGQKGRWFGVADPNGFLGVWRPLGALARMYLTPPAGFSPVLHNLYAGQRPVISVDGSDTAVIGRVVVGGTIEKVGSGRLSISSADGGGLNVYLKEGALDLAGTADAEIEDLLEKAALHLDASDAGSIVKGTSEDGTTVTAWYDVRGNAGYPYAAHDPYIGTSSDKIPYANDPLYVPEASPTGLAMVDFGIKGASETVRSYCTMKIFPERLDNIRAVFYVAEHPYGLGNTSVIGDHNKNEWMAGSKDAQLYDPGYSAPVVRSGEITVNRFPVTDSTAVDAGTFSNLHVLAQSTLGDAGFGFLCTRHHGAAFTGGARVGEVIVYTNELTNVERARLAAYLDAKWRLGRVDDVDAVTVYSSSSREISVPAGRSVGVGRVVSEDGFVKTGGGELRIGEMTPETATVSVMEGTVAFDSRGTGAGGETVAADAYLWLDAGDSGSLGMDGGTTYVRSWNDRRDGRTLAATSYFDEAPHMPRLIESPVCGRPVLDFGAWNSSGTAWASGNDGAWMQLPNAGDGGKHGAYHYFCVMRLKNESIDPSVNRKKNGIPVIWGNSMDVYSDRGTPLSTSYVPGVTAAARWCVNGKVIDPLVDMTLTSASATNDFVVLSIASAVPWQCDEICHERNEVNYEYQGGGFEVGEMIVFDRPISAEAHRSVEAYLMEKWLNRTHPATVPVRPTLAFAPDADVVLSSQGPLDIADLTGGNGRFVKRGPGSVSVRAGWESLGSVSVEEGRLSLEMTNGAGPLSDEALFHFDVSDADSLELHDSDGAGVTNIASWADVRGNGLSATAARNSYAKADPTLVSVETRPGVWRPAVDFGGYSGRLYVESTGADVNAPVSSASSAQLSFSQIQAGVKDVYLVYADAPDERRAWILGGDSYYMREVIDGSGAIFQGYKKAEVAYVQSWLRGNAVVDGVSVEQSTVLPAGFHTIAVATSNDKSTTVGAFAGGSATGAGDGAQVAAFAGGCRISEALAFNRVLTAEERAWLTGYLDYKWFGEGEAPVTNGLSSVSVAAGATLSFHGAESTLVRTESLAGAGRVVCPALMLSGTLASSLANGISGGCLTVDGKLKIDGPVTLALSIDTSAGRLRPGDYPILAASSMDGFDPGGWTISATPADSRVGCWTVVKRGNVLYLAVRKPGMVLIVK